MAAGVRMCSKLLAGLGLLNLWSGVNRVRAGFRWRCPILGMDSRTTRRPPVDAAYTNFQLRRGLRGSDPRPAKRERARRPPPSNRESAPLPAGSARAPDRESRERCNGRRAPAEPRGDCNPDGGQRAIEYRPAAMLSWARAFCESSLSRSLFSPHVRCVLIVAQAHKSRMPEVAVRGPFHEFELSHQHRLQPYAVFHLFSRQALCPAARMLLR